MIRFAENLNKMIAAGLGGALEAPSTEVAVGHRLRYMEASGPVADFETNIAAPIRSLRVDMQPIQAGSGDPSPDNVRPITGRDSVMVTRTGKNLYSREGSVYSAPVYGPDGTIGTYPDVAVWWIKVKPSTEYTISCIQTTEQSYIRIGACDANKGFISRIFGATGSSQLPRTITTPSNCEWAQIAVNQYDTAHIAQNDWQICIKEGTNSTYEPYDDQSVTIQLGQTVYGGTLDVSTGKLTVTHGEIASYNGEALPGEWISDRDVYAAGTTPTIGAQVVYVLDTPQTIDLDPQQITTLIGDNNVWSDAGNISLEYPYYEETEGY